MPGPMEKWLGLAAFADGWLGQDAAEQEQQLQYLESIANVAGRAQDIRGAQSTERRTQALFPGVQEQQGLQTTQMGIETRGMERGEEMQGKLDTLIQDQYGLPSWEVFKTLVDAKQTDVLQRFADATLASRVPEETVKGQEAKVTGERRTEEQFLRGPGPEAVAGARTATALQQQQQQQYEMLVTDLKRRRGTPKILVDTEAELGKLAPLGKKIDMISAYAAAKHRMGQAANTPLGKDQIMRQIFADKGLDYDAYIIRGFLIDKGEMESKQTLLENIFKAEEARARILASEGDIDTAQAFMLSTLQNNPNMADKIGAFMPQKPTDVREIVKPLNDYINANKALMHEYHDVSYDKMAQRQLQFTEGDLKEVIGGMMENFAGFSDDNAEDIRLVLVNLINRRDPMHWDTWMQKFRPGLIQRWSQEEWNAAQQVLDTVQWRMGQEEDPDLVRPRPPYMGMPKKTMLPLGALQRTERQQKLEQRGLGGIDAELNRIMGGAEEQLQLDSVEAELQRLLGE